VGQLVVGSALLSAPFGSWALPAKVNTARQTPSHVFVAAARMVSVVFMAPA
jgi:hypothetical protein